MSKQQSTVSSSKHSDDLVGVFIRDVVAGAVYGIFHTTVFLLGTIIIFSGDYELPSLAVIFLNTLSIIITPWFILDRKCRFSSYYMLVGVVYVLSSWKFHTFDALELVECIYVWPIHLLDSIRELVSGFVGLLLRPLDEWLIRLF